MIFSETPEPPVATETRSHGSAYFPAFDYLRMGAAVGVFLAHADEGGFLPKQLGNACVQVFFSLSGFLIGGILLDSKPRDLPRFYYNRVARIWIPYAIAIFLLLSVTLVKQPLNDHKLWEFFFYKITFVYNWFGPPQIAGFWERMPLQGTGNHFWSICVEEQFYLLAPFVLLFLSRAVAIACLVVLLALNFFYPYDFSAIALGVLLAISRHQFGSWYVPAPVRLSIAAIATLSATAIQFRFLPYSAAFPVVGVSIIALLASEGSPTKVGTTVGGMSYPFYLNHWIGLFTAHLLIRRVGIYQPLSWAIGFAIPLLLCYLHYRFIDRNIAIHRSNQFTERLGFLCGGVGFGLILIGLGVGFYFVYYPLK